MRRIIINQHIEDLSRDYAKSLFRSRIASFVKPMSGLNILLGRLRALEPGLVSNYGNYVYVIIRSYRLLNDIRPEKFDQLHNRLFAHIPVTLSEKITVNNKKKAFYEHVCDAMRYDAVRDEDFLPYVRKLGIRACVYCNVQYALSINFEDKDYAKFELDHSKPQSEFPYLCTNFFNLTPSCPNCNKYKSGNPVNFSLYTSDPLQLNPFSFKLDKHSVVKYMLSRNFEDLRIIFDHGTDPGYQTTFKIDATYNVLKDVVEEIIWKHKIYSENYLEALNEAFSKKFSKGDFLRFILGNYTSPQDVHKRPLAKLTQDIAIQLKIIK